MIIPSRVVAHLPEPRDRFAEKTDVIWLRRHARRAATDSDALPSPAQGPIAARRAFAATRHVTKPEFDPSNASAKLGLAAVIARKNLVRDEFAQLKRETESLALGIEKITAGDVLLTKALEDRGTWLWVDTATSALDAVKTMTKANVGALLVMRASVLDAGGGAW